MHAANEASARHGVCRQRRPLARACAAIVAESALAATSLSVSDTRVELSTEAELEEVSDVPPSHQRM